jgi:hypothetical protein
MHTEVEEETALLARSVEDKGLGHISFVHPGARMPHWTRSKSEYPAPQPKIYGCGFASTSEAPWRL